MGGDLKEIARLSGVAVSSVSRALTGKPGVSREKRREILEIASRIGYRPNPEARTLRTGRASDLLVIIQDRPNDITSYRNHALIVLAGGAFERVRVQTCSASDPLAALLARAAEEGVAAVIVSGVQEEVPHRVAQQLEEAATAVVCLDCTKRLAPESNTIDRVDIDRESGAYEAARLLLSRAGRETLFFAKKELCEVDARLTGIRRACVDAGFTLSKRMLVPVEGDDFAEGREVTRALLRRNPPRGLFCYNDKLAVGALRAISEKGLRVPDDIMVVGFDDLSFAAYLTVPLTTVAQPVVACAEAAVDLALLRREDPRRPVDRRLFESRLVVRETAAPRK
ncbi:MAG TPA: LacI family DNA-binding transcriptional regulator [Spirochaetia bacterium]|nr:LacI family DNA-binding transcriptional regulator [Spirochaetia bacterium]